jgi:hypothetical protein
MLSRQFFFSSSASITMMPLGPRSVNVLISRHAAKRTAAVPRGYLKGFVDIVDREGDTVHANLVGISGLRLDRFGVDVFKSSRRP